MNRRFKGVRTGALISTNCAILCILVIFLVSSICKMWSYLFHNNVEKIKITSKWVTCTNISYCWRSGFQQENSLHSWLQNHLIDLFIKLLICQCLCYIQVPELGWRELIPRWRTLFKNSSAFSVLGQITSIPYIFHHVLFSSTLKLPFKDYHEKVIPFQHYILFF